MRSELLAGLFLVTACRPITPWGDVEVLDRSGEDYPYSADQARVALDQLAAATGLEGSWVTTVVVEERWQDNGLVPGAERPARWQRRGGVVSLHAQTRFGVDYALRYGACMALEDQHNYARELGVSGEDTGEGEGEGFGSEFDYEPSGRFEHFAWRCAQPIHGALELAVAEVCGSVELDPDTLELQELVFPEAASEVVRLGDTLDWTWVGFTAEDPWRIWEWAPASSGLHALLIDQTVFPPEYRLLRWSASGGAEEPCGEIALAEEGHDASHHVILSESHLWFTAESTEGIRWTSLDLETCELIQGDVDPVAQPWGHWAAVGNKGLVQFYERATGESYLVAVDLTDGSWQRVSSPWEQPELFHTDVVDGQVIAQLRDDIAVWDPAGNELLEWEGRLPSDSRYWVALEDEQWLSLWWHEPTGTYGWALRDLVDDRILLSPSGCGGIGYPSCKAVEGTAWCYAEQGFGFLRP